MLRFVAVPHTLPLLDEPTQAESAGREDGNPPHRAEQGQNLLRCGSYWKLETQQTDDVTKISNRNKKTIGLMEPSPFYINYKNG